MKENNTVKKTRKHSKRFVGFVIAAAVLGAGTIGAGAYAFAQFNNRQNVERYLGQETADKLENSGYAMNAVSENEHVRVTLDTVLSDGQSAEMILTLEKLDDKARDMIRQRPDIRFSYGDTGEEFVPHGSSTSIYYGDDRENDPKADIFSFMVRIPPTGTDFSRPVNISFITEYGEIIGVLEDIGFELDLTKNVETAQLISEDGTELTLSPFGISGTTQPYTEDGHYDVFEIIMLKSDGSCSSVMDMNIDLTYSGGKTVYFDSDQADPGDVTPYFTDEVDDGFFSLFLPTFFDIDDYIGIEIEGVQYLKQ